MKNSMKTIALATLVGFLGCALKGCKEDEYAIIDGAVFHKTYITQYLDPSGFVAEEAATGDSMSVSLCFDGSLITSGTKFDELSKYYGDDAFNRSIVPSVRTVVNDSIRAIEIKCVDGFDDTHPAGSDISDFVEVRYVSYHEYVKSGYVYVDKGDVAEWKGLIEYMGESGAQLLKGMAADVNFGNTNMMERQLLLTFTKKPANAGAFRFEVVMHMSESVLSQTIECIF